MYPARATLNKTCALSESFPVSPESSCTPNVVKTVCSVVYVPVTLSPVRLKPPGKTSCEYVKTSPVSGSNAAIDMLATSPIFAITSGSVEKTGAVLEPAECA